MQETLNPILSVSEFIEYVNLALGARQVTVEGEIANFRLSQGKWVFFDLKDDQSIVNCFTPAYRLECALEDGMQVRARGVPRVHGKSGKFSITAEHIELAGIGALKRAYELTKAKLEKEGMFSSERKRVLPRFPLCIGLIASRESAAYTDFMRILFQRWNCEVRLIHVHVQGAQAVQEIVSAIQYINDYDTDVEAIALIRGGGSMEDLQAFNTEHVARAVFGSRVPVISGVGHERDETLADYAADVRAATPTHAAALIAPDRQEILHIITRSCMVLENGMKHFLREYTQRIAYGMQIIQRTLHMCVYAFQRTIQQFYSAMQTYETRIHTVARVLADRQRLCMVYAEQKMHTKKNAFFSLERTLAGMNPLTVLTRGYGIVRKNKKIISGVSQISSGDDIDIQFSDGSLTARVHSPQRTLPL